MWRSPSDRPQIVYTADEASAMDRWLIDERGFTLERLMGQAGARLADAVRELCAAEGCERAVFLVGPGNNGGDALVAERLVRGELATRLWRPLVRPGAPELDARTLLVDGLFGVGLARPIGGAARQAVEHVHASAAKVLSVDVPSGLSATTGEVVGVTRERPDGGVAVRAEWTLTFVGPKAGFFVAQGPAHVGLWRAVEIGFPAQQAEDWVRARRASGAGA
ncbi:MAG: hypothetical protein H6825_12845 [Planctomycetes bacterium]|nr:hypothetical protein [Planctomycetota bacterium]